MNLPDYMFSSAFRKKSCHTALVDKGCGNARLGVHQEGRHDVDLKSLDLIARCSAPPIPQILGKLGAFPRRVGSCGHPSLKGSDREYSREVQEGIGSSRSRPKTQGSFRLETSKKEMGEPTLDLRRHIFWFANDLYILDVSR